MKTDSYAEMLRNLPSSLHRAVARVLSTCWGEERAISRDRLVQAVKLFPGQETAEDRTVRKAIEDLRAGGLLIGNVGDGSGYYLVSNREEYNRFRAMYAARAYAVLEVVRAMDQSAAEKFGQDPTTFQPSLL